MLKTKRAAAVFTICRNESLFIPIWLRYYRQHYQDRDIYVLDHESTDGSTDNMPNRVVVKNTLTQDNDWLIKVTCDFQKQLLGLYKNVLFVNVDEFVVPKQQTLKEYVQNLSEEYIRCTGFEVLHMRDEAAYDPLMNVLDQRRFWYKNTVYNKPLLSQSPIEWTGGWHNSKNFNVAPDPFLHLIHLHRMDYMMCLARHKKTSSESIYRPDLDDKKWGWHHVVHENDDFSKWFYCLDAAKILDAERSLKIFQEVKKMPFDDVYSRATKLVEEIPVEFRVV